MEIQYQREMNQSLMVIEEIAGPLNMDTTLALKMTKDRPLAGLLGWDVVERNGRIRFSYDITGLVSLSDYIEQNGLSASLLTKLFERLFILTDRLPLFYLKSTHLMLQTNMIFLDSDKEDPFFCYESMQELSIHDEISRLLEELIVYINHKDSEAVRIGYGLYEKSQEENSDIRKGFFELLSRNKKENTGSSCEEKESSLEQYSKEPITSVKYPKEEIKEKKGLYELFKSKAKFSMGFAEESSPFNLRGYLPKKEERNTSPVYSMNADEDEKSAEDNYTVLIGNVVRAGGKLEYIGNGREEDFYISSDSFLLGGRNPKADGVLNAPGISRNHAKITLEGENYYIEDMNSKNGTFLNGETLAYKERRVLKSGDHICFGKEEFIFR